MRRLSIALTAVALLLLAVPLVLMWILGGGPEPTEDFGVGIILGAAAPLCVAAAGVCFALSAAFGARVLWTGWRHESRLYVTAMVVSALAVIAILAAAEWWVCLPDPLTQVGRC